MIKREVNKRTYMIEIKINKGLDMIKREIYKRTHDYD